MALRIDIDRERCMGSGNCCFHARATFDLDDECKATVVDPAGDADEAIRHAAESCPTKAIELHEVAGFTPRPVAAQFFALRRALREDYEGTLQRVSEMGFLGVEPMLMEPAPADLDPATADMIVPWRDVRALRRLLDDLGLAVCSVHGSSLPEPSNADRVLDQVEALGTDKLVLPSWSVIPEIGPDAHLNLDHLKQVVERFDAAADLAAARGMQVGFHNHHFDFEGDFGGKSAYDLFWEWVDPRVFAQLDVYWAQTAGRDPVALLRSLGERVRGIHLKDGPCVVGEPHTAVGSGRVDIEAAVRAAEHVDWHIVELDDCATDMLAAVGDSCRYLLAQGLSRGRC